MEKIKSLKQALKIPRILKPTSGANSTKWLLLRSAFAELLGTCFLVYLGCGAMITNTVVDKPNTEMRRDTTPIALSFGFAAYVIVYSIGGISGGHINPAISTAFLVAAKLSFVEWVFYVSAQMIGGIIGAALLAISHGSGDFFIASSCNTVPSSMRVSQAFFLEFFLTAILTFAVFAVVDPSNRGPQSRTSAPHVVGMMITVCHLVALQSTGTSVNPARSFGPAVVSGFDEIPFSNKHCWKEHWVFWIAPILGAIASSLLYTYYFDGGLKGTTSNITESDVEAPKVIKVRSKTERSTKVAPAPEATDTTPMFASKNKSENKTNDIDTDTDQDDETHGDSDSDGD
eukprot:m.39287 g.39287  ORF g.39287 m.39287 type:complete len:344 (-) comp18161_c0_seq1:109-1140(-)